MTSNSKFSLIRSANVWSGAEGWELLFYYNLYRFGLAVVLFVISTPNFENLSFGNENRSLIFAIVGFTVVSIISFINIKRQSPAIHIQAHALFLLDMLFISILALSKEIDEANIIVFFITTIAATAVMFRTKAALGYAIIAIFVIYFQDSLEFIRGETALNDYYLTAFSALGLFTIVVIVSRIARRTRVVQNVLEQQELDLQDMDAINQIVVDQMEIGILFLEDDLSIKLINNSAREMVGDYINRAKVRSKLADLINEHVKMPSGKHFVFRHKDKVLNFSSTSMRSGALIRIEDNTTLSRKIQQTKLSSVGRFASAISHEIRNPLNAINHAAQLMQTDTENPENNEMVNMIRKHVKRINNIVESILDRSRPGKAKQEEIQLKSWLDEFINTFKQSIGDEEIFLSQIGKSENIYFDPTQLEQILTNLCQNSIKYGKTPAKLLEISMKIGRDEHSIPYLDVMNNGATIPEDKAEKLFEPFYTTQSNSTGLGLYLSKEFCVLNGADIVYFNDIDKHGFRILFKLQDSI